VNVPTKDVSQLLAPLLEEIAMSKDVIPAGLSVAVPRMLVATGPRYPAAGVVTAAVAANASYVNAAVLCTV
jgi:hypothetical protein